MVRLGLSLWSAHKPIEPEDCSKSQTSGASPAQPGDLLLIFSMPPALKERQRIASACPGYLTVVVERWDEPRCSESFAAKISFGPIPQLLQSWMFSCTDPGFRSAPPWAEFLLRLRRVKIPLALCSSRPPDLTTVGFHSTRVDRRNSRTLGYVICVLASGWLGSIMSWGIPRAVGNS